jgi:uncharacterized membrane protein YeaQ/YmgE (transglycosylase-associated protein family)
MRPTAIQARMRKYRFGLIGAIVNVSWRPTPLIMPDFWRNLITATVGSIICICIWRAILGTDLAALRTPP